MWIMLKKKLPTQVSPPKLSIHWSMPWPIKEAIASRKARGAKMPGEKKCELLDDPWHVPAEPNYYGARRIHYKGEDIRVFPHEFTTMESDRLMEYIDGGALELVAGDAAEEIIVEAVLTGTRRQIYEAALVDGCSHAQALMTGLGQDITLPDAAVPPVGWFRMLSPYAEVFTHEYERTE